MKDLSILWVANILVAKMILAPKLTSMTNGRIICGESQTVLQTGHVALQV